MTGKGFSIDPALIDELFPDPPGKKKPAEDIDLDDTFGSPETPAGTSAKGKEGIDLDDIFAPGEAVKDKAPTKSPVPAPNKVEQAIETLVAHLRAVGPEKAAEVLALVAERAGKFPG